MNCDTIQDRFAERFDDRLSAADRGAFDDHVAQCSHCEREWAAYEDAVSALQSRGSEPTSADLHAHILAAVDADVAAAAARSRRWHLQLLAGGCALAGAAAALLLVWLVPGLRPGGESTERVVEVRVPEIREVPVEVPVRVEVPIRVEVPVATPVRVEVPVPVEVEVERGPLLEVDTGALADAMAELAASELARAFVAGIGRAAAIRASREQLQSTPQLPRGASDRNLLAARQRPRTPPAQLESTTTGGDAERASIAIRRRGDRVVVAPSGPVEDYVPMLIAKLTYAEPDVRAAIEDQLSALHERAATDPRTRSRAVAPPPTGPQQQQPNRNIFRTGRREAELVAMNPADRWTQWWSDNRAVIAQLQPGNPRTAP